jgi:gliding motility-associated-like protein
MAFNDVWNIDQLVNYPNATVEIYTRTGQKIFATVGYTRPWDGTYNNKPVPVATYYYIINPKLTGTSILSGSVTVIR